MFRAKEKNRKLDKNSQTFIVPSTDKLLLRKVPSVVLRSWKQGRGPGLTEKIPSREVSEVMCLANNCISQPLAVRCGHIATFKTKSCE